MSGRMRLRSRFANLVGNNDDGSDEDETGTNYTTTEPEFVIHRGGNHSGNGNDHPRSRQKHSDAVHTNASSTNKQMKSAGDFPQSTTTTSMNSQNEDLFSIPSTFQISNQSRGPGSTYSGSSAALRPRPSGRHDDDSKSSLAPRPNTHHVVDETKAAASLSLPTCEAPPKGSHRTASGASTSKINAVAAPALVIESERIADDGQAILCTPVASRTKQIDNEALVTPFAHTPTGADVSLDLTPSFANTPYGFHDRKGNDDGGVDSGDVNQDHDPAATSPSKNKKLAVFVSKANAKLKQRQEMIGILSSETTAQEEEMKLLQRQISEAQDKLEQERTEAQDHINDVFHDLQVYQYDEDDEDNDYDSKGELICLDANYVSRLHNQVFRSTVVRNRLEKQLLFVKGSCDEIVQSLRDSLHQTEKKAAEDQQSLLSELSTATVTKAELEYNSHHRLEAVNAELSTLEEELAQQQVSSKQLNKQQQTLETSRAHLEMDMMNQLTKMSATKAVMEEEYVEQLQHTTQLLETLEEEIETMRYNYRASGLFVPAVDEYSSKSTTKPLTLGGNGIGDDGDHNNVDISQISSTALDTSFDEDGVNEDAERNIFRGTQGADERLPLSLQLKLQNRSVSFEGDAMNSAHAQNRGTIPYHNHKRHDSELSFYSSSSAHRRPPAPPPSSIFQSSNLPPSRDLHHDFGVMRRQDQLWRRTQHDLELAQDVLRLISMVGNASDSDRSSISQSTVEGRADIGHGQDPLEDTTKARVLSNTLLLLEKATRRLEVESSKLHLDLSSSNDIGSSNNYERVPSMMLPLPALKKILRMLDNMGESRVTEPSEGERQALGQVLVSLYANNCNN
jgi:hypothetical protein